MMRKTALAHQSKPKSPKYVVQELYLVSFIKSEEKIWVF